MKKVAKREFIIDTTKMTAGAVGTITFGSAVLSADRALAAKEKFLKPNCRFEKVNRNRTLVAYANNFGSTREVAGALGRQYAKAERLLMCGCLIRT